VNSSISFSVVAKLFPSSTTTEANLSILFNGSQVTLAILANPTAASSAVKLVVTAIFATVSVNFVKSQIPTPSCHHSSAIFAISSNATGIFVLNNSNSFLIALNSGSVAVNVFLTQANADSKLIASFAVLLKKDFTEAKADNISQTPKKAVNAFCICLHTICACCHIELNLACSLLKSLSQVFT